MATSQYNYLPKQYQVNNQLPISHNYLPQQFSNSEAIIDEIRELVKRGDFTLGQAVDELEDEFKKITQTKFAIGVGSGTDAIFLSLKAAGIEKGDEVITVPYTFYATIGAIVTAGATPVFVDVGPDYNINPEKIEEAITSRTKAIVPVHWSGLLCDMERIHQIAKKHNMFIVEDACHAINAERNNMRAGALGSTACFSMHPLKNLNVWGDGGMIVTNSKKLHKKFLLLRNHGLINRDLSEVFAYNSRLDTLQAIVGKHLLTRIDEITKARIGNANYFDKHLSTIPQISVPVRLPSARQVFHLYVIKVKDRDFVKNQLIQNGISTGIHYPTALPFLKAYKYLGHNANDFPVSYANQSEMLSLPMYPELSEKQIKYVCHTLLGLI